MRDRDISERAIALTSEKLSRNSGIRTKRTRSRWVTISTAYGLTIKPLAAPRWEALAEAVGDKRDRCTGRHGHWVLLSNEAEDPVQDVFATFLDRLDQFEGRPQLRTWLFGILHRKTLDWRRAAAVDDRMDPIDVTAT